MRISMSRLVLNSIRHARHAACVVCALVLAQGVSTPQSLAGTSVASMPLSGTGVESRVTFSEPLPALTTNPPNTKIKHATIMVSVTGTGPLKLTAAPTITKTSGATESKFWIAGGSCSAGKEIAPGETCTIAVKYAPANKATATAHVTLTGRGGREEKLHSGSFFCN
jgi:hypothetical protein